MARVTVVDDSADDREMMERWLLAHGHEVSCYAGGIKALAAIINDPPQALVLDLTMPEMDGFSLLAALRVHPRFGTLPVVIWTGASARDILNRARSLQVRAILNKARDGLDSVCAAVEAAVRSQPVSSNNRFNP
jgi:CheY-like chemotaxis protein